MLETTDAEAIIGSLSIPDRRLFFASLRMDVTAAFARLDDRQKCCWSEAARQLVEILQLFEREPTNNPECSMIHAVELACEFMAQLRHALGTNRHETVH